MTIKKFLQTCALYLRSSIFFIGMVLYTIFHATLSLLTFPLPLQYRYLFITYWSRIMLRWLKLSCGLAHEVVGLEHIKGLPSGIVLCKHQSMWETLGVQVIFPQQTWVMKQELLRIPFFGWALRLLNPIAIDRTQRASAMEQLIQQGRATLEQGRWVVIFPEGTRVGVGQSKRFTKGGARLACATQYPVIPVAHNAGMFWRRRGFLKYPGTIRVVIGAPIDPTAYTPEQLTDYVARWINQTVASLEREVETNK